jgi:tRNA G18 (ribose-2'-O)-methylase SpoU
LPLRNPKPPVYVVEQPLMNEIVGFNIHRGCLALAERPPRRSLDEIFRSAAAFGVEAVVLGPSCGDPLYRKAIRTSMAATLQVPFVDAGAWPGALDMFRQGGLRVLALSTSLDARPLDELPRALGRIALLVGGEGSGLSAAALAASDERVRIPMTAGVDSLNVTVAASIVLHHFAPSHLSPS